MSKFEDKSKVKLVLVVTIDEKDIQEFAKNIHPADREIKKDGSKTISIADYKNNILYVFKKPKEGIHSFAGFDDCHEIQLTQRAHEDLKFYSKVATLVNKIEERNIKETK